MLIFVCLLCVCICIWNMSIWIEVYLFRFTEFFFSFFFVYFAIFCCYWTRYHIIVRNIRRRKKWCLVVPSYFLAIFSFISYIALYFFIIIVILVFCTTSIYLCLFYMLNTKKYCIDLRFEAVIAPNKRRRYNNRYFIHTQTICSLSLSTLSLFSSEFPRKTPKKPLAKDPAWLEVLWVWIK